MRNAILIAVLFFVVGCSSSDPNKRGLCEIDKNYEGIPVAIEKSEVEGVSTEMYSIMATFLKTKGGKGLREIAFLKGMPPYMIIRVGALESESKDQVDAVIFLDKQYVSDDNCFRLTYVGNGSDGQEQYLTQDVSLIPRSE